MSKGFENFIGLHKRKLVLLLLIIIILNTWQILEQITNTKDQGKKRNKKDPNRRDITQNY